MKKTYFKRNYKKLLLLIILIILLSAIITAGVKICFLSDEKTIEENITDNDTGDITITYVGDLILLKDQVINSYDEKSKKYNFDYMFEHAKKYFNEADYSIGVFEGPISNAKKGYSTSNYGDGIKTYLGFPKEFADSVKKSGIDFVTTANNHLMDQGENGVYDTIDYLNKIGLNHTGSYKDEKEKNKVKIINIQGVKIAVLSYTISSNYYSSDYFINEKPNLTSVLVSEKSPNFEKVKSDVKSDFDRAKIAGADLIMVMPHMGTQFIHETNEMQELWNDIFISNGADIILGDHSHATQPVYFDNDTLVVNCPGNFANSYIKDDGDGTSIVEFYINKSSKKVTKASVIPMYTHEISKDKFEAVPIYDIYADSKIYETFKEKDLKRANEIFKIVTSSMTGIEVKDNQIQNKFYIYKEKKDNNFDLKKAYDKSKLKSIFEDSKKITFIGDSVTYGTGNGGHGWYEPITDMFSDLKVDNISHGSYTTKNVIKDFSKKIENSKADSYFIAVGVNDVRYRNEKICAMTTEDYTKNIKEIISHIPNKDAKIVLIAPWPSLISDPISKLNYEDKEILLKDYSNALKDFALENDYIYVDPSKYISEFLKLNSASDYLIDYIHPNSDKGIKLYSYAVLNG